MSIHILWFWFTQSLIIHYKKKEIDQRIVVFGDIIGKYGERLPSHTNSPKSFRVATVIVSNKLLNSKEMSFYGYYASRSEWTQETNVAEGYHVYTSRPFFLATGGRGSLNVSIVK